MSDDAPRLLTDKASIRILIVEDDPKAADLIQAWLEPVGYQLQVVRSEAEALAVLKHDVPDLVILDLLLEDGRDVDKPRGYEVCRHLRADPRTEGVPVLMFTVLDELEKIERGVEVDADDYMLKLSSSRDVLFHIESLLRVRHIKKRVDRMIAYLRLLEEGPGETPGSPPSPGGM